MLVTLDSDNYAEWKRMAEGAGMPVATLIRESLDMMLPSMRDVFEVVKMHRDEPEVMDEVMGRILWKAIKVGAK